METEKKRIAEICVPGDFPVERKIAPQSESSPAMVI
jgi:hypothetical protein